MKGIAVLFMAIVALTGFAGVISQTTLIAHRGESVDAPENTLPAYQMAVERGFGFECDIYLSQDGRLFTFHDSNLKRTTAGAHTEACTKANWEETLAHVNVGGWGKWKGSKFDPTRPALLEEVLALARPRRMIYVEVKGNNPKWAPKIKEVFARQKAATPQNTLFITFGAKIAAALKKEMPEYKLFYLMDTCKPSARKRNQGRKIASVNGNDAADKGKVGVAKEKRQRRQPWTPEEILEKLCKIGADGVDIEFSAKVHDAAFVKKIHAAGKEFHVWTVDDIRNAEKAFAAGVDTLTTNCAQKLLEQHKKGCFSVDGQKAARKDGKKKQKK